MIPLLALAVVAAHPHHAERHHSHYHTSDLTDYDTTVNRKVDAMRDDDDKESLHDKMTALEMDRESEPEKVKEDLENIRDYAVLHDVDCDECKDIPDPE